MDLVLLTSIALRLVAVGWALRLWRRIGDWRLGLLAGMATLMALRQVLTGVRSGGATLTVMRPDEIPGLVVSALLLATIVAVEQLIQRQRDAVVRAHQAQARYRMLFEQAAEGVFVMGAAGDFLDANRRGLEMLGYDLAELRECRVNDVVESGSDTVGFPNAPSPAGQILEAEHPFVRRDGTRFVGHVLVRHLPDGRLIGTVRDVTAAREAERKLQRTASQLAEAQRLAGVGSWTWDPATSRVTWSDELHRIHGVHAGGFDGALDTHLAGVVAEDRERVRDAIDGARASGAAFSLDYRIARPSGAIRVLRATGRVVPAATNVPALMVTCLDVTEMLETTEQLRKTVALLGAVTEGTGDAVFAKDLDGVYRMINTAAARSLDLEVDQIIGKTDADIFSRDLAVRMLENDRAVITSGELRMVEEPGEGPRDTRHTFLVTRGPWRDDRGDIVGVVGIARDITERKRAEEAAAAGEAFLRFSQQIGRVGSWEWNLVTDQVTWSDEMYNIHGITREEFSGTPQGYAPLVHPDDLPRVEALIRHLLSGGGNRSIEYRVVRPDGEVRDMYGTNATLHDRTSRQRRVIGTVQDVTELKETERALRRTGEQLAVALEAARMGTWEWDITTGDVRWSPNVERIFGLAPGSLAGTLEAYREMIHPDDQAAVQAVIDEVLAGRTTDYEIAHRVVDPGGRVRWIGGKGRVHRDAAGAPQSMIGTVADITDRKRAEESLREREELFRSIYDQAVVGIVLAGVPEGRLLRSNPAFCEMIGYTASELLAMSVTDITHPDDRAASGDLIREIVRGERPRSEFEKRYVRKDGTLLWAHLNVSSIPDASRRTQYLLAVVTDITDRKAAEEAVRESQERFRSLVQHASEAIVILDADTRRFVEVNPRAEALFGLNREELLRVGPADLSPSTQPDGQQSAEAAAEQVQVALDGSTPAFEWTHRHADGRDFPCEVRLLRLPGAGRLIRGVMVDISERKRAEDALRREKAQFETLFEGAPEAIILVDNQGLVMRVNTEFTRLFGYSADEAAGRRLDDLIVPPDFMDQAAALTQAVSEGERTSVEAVRLAKDGRSIDVSVLGAPVTVEGGQVAVLAIYRDISARKQAERALHESQRQLEAAQTRARLGSWEYHPDSGIGSWSKEMFRLFSRDPALGSPTADELIEFVHPDDRERVVAAQGAAMTGPDPHTIDFRSDPARVPARHFSATWHSVRDEAGRVLYLAGTVLDITERKAAEEALRASETRFRALIEHSFDVITLFGEDGEVLYVSPSVERVLGYRPPELIGKPGIHLVHPDDTAASEEGFGRALAHPGATVQLSHRVRHRDGSYRQVEVAGTNLLDEPSVRALVSNLRDVTDRDQAERALRESEERYRTLFQNSPVGIGVADINGNLTAFNDAMLEPGGYTREDVEALRNVANLYYDPDDRPRVLALLRRDGVVRGCEVPFKRHDGSAYDASLSLTPITLDGKPAVIAIVQDITERKRAERALQRSEERYRLMFNAAPVALWEEDYSDASEAIRAVCAQGVTDIRTYLHEHPEFARGCIRMVRILDVNEAALELFGVDTKDALLGTLEPFVGPESYDTVLEEFVAIAEGREIFEVETSADGPMGGPLYIRLRVRFPTDVSEFDNVLVSMVDLTDRKLAEDAIHRQVAFTRRLLETTTDGFVLADVEGRILEVNPAYCALVGFNETELRSQNISFVEASMSPPEIQVVVDRIMNEGSARFETKHRRKSGVPLEIEVSASVTERDGEPIIAAFVRDISERARAEREMLRSREEMRQLARRLERVREEERTVIAREIHDELGQALTGLKLDVSWLASKYPRTWKKVRERVKATLRTVDRTIDTVRDLSTRLRPAILDDLGLVAAVEWQAKDAAGRGGLECHLALDPGAEAVDRDRATALFRIFQETCTNILRHADATRIDVSLTADDEAIRLSVTDDGVGIATGATRNRSSLGVVGMRERALSHDGTLTVRPLAEGGTVVLVEMPRRNSEVSP